MKITDIRIERYGVWNHLALPLQSAGLNVFYGPNEAGKTTLLRFIRDVLYRSPAGTQSWQGAMRLAHQDRYCEVNRWGGADGSQGLEFQELDPNLAWNAEPDWAVSQDGDFDGVNYEGQSAEEALEVMLARTPARLFQHVFAIGLTELQELATLHDREVSQQIYGLSLGLEGRRLLSICGEMKQPSNSSKLFRGNRETIAKLLKRDAELQAELEKYAGQRERYEQLLDRQDQLETQIEKDKRRQAELQQQLGGHETVQRVWKPWNQVREYEAELRTMPVVPAVSGIDPAKLTALENDLRELSRQRKTVLSEIAALRKSLRASAKNSAKQQEAAGMQGFVNQRGWLAQTERELELAVSRARELKTEFEARQKQLGSDWPVHRLTAVDTSRAAYTRLVDAARAYQSAQSRLAALRKRYDKYAAACHQRQGELDQQIAALPEQALDKALDATRQQLKHVEELTRLQLKETELVQRIASQKRELTRVQEQAQVPEWVPGFLLFLAIGGLILSGLGFYTSLTSNGIAGAILGLVGIAGFAIARAFQRDAGEGLEQGESAGLQSVIHQQEQSLHDVRAAIKRNTPRTWLVTVTEAELAKERIETVLGLKLSERITDLKKLESRKGKLASKRRRLSRMRKAQQTRQRDVAQAREDWCAALKQSGLNETLPVEKAFELWQKITEAMEHMRAWDAAREAASDIEGRYEDFCQRLIAFGEKSGHSQMDYSQPVRVLDLWQKELAFTGEETDEQHGLKRELRDRRREAQRLKQKMLSIRSARSALLLQVGATSREDFAQRLELGNRRRELQELLQIARAELRSFCQSHPELAIVEDDLARYNAGQNDESIELIKLELEELELRAVESLENLGRIKHELDSLENDRRPAELRFEREAITGKLRRCLEENAAIRLGAKTVQRIRRDFEQSSQPQILEIASDYLAQLTCGTYQKIWTTLDEQQLLVMDADENSVTVEQLSNGTREQLFLALRLGLVSEFANRGIELPMVLDDVLVNFDQYRTEAAIQTLIEFAERGHQVLLFTSHLHLARLCESQGIDPVWLPAHHAALEHRRAG